MVFINKHNFFYDERQYQVICEIDELMKHTIKAQNSLFNFSKNRQHIFYLYGTVGSGKSFIVNLIFKNFSSEKKLRMTFYNFIDNLRNKIYQTIGTKYELSDLIKSELKNLSLLCIDEFHISDMANAKIVIEFLKIISQLRNIIVIINSNRHPRDLYHGAYKERFYPAVQILETHGKIIELATKDYRIYLKCKSQNYFITNDKEYIKQLFIRDASGKFEQKTWEIFSKKIVFLIDMEIIYARNKIAFFDFNELFTKPLYANIYQRLISEWYLDKIYLSNVPKFDNCNDIAMRFIAFIDVAYEMSLSLRISSEYEPGKLYESGKYIFEFQRTISRIKVLTK